MNKRLQRPTQHHSKCLSFNSFFLNINMEKYVSEVCTSVSLCGKRSEKRHFINFSQKSLKKYVFSQIFV